MVEILILILIFNKKKKKEYNQLDFKDKIELKHNLSYILNRL